MASTPSSSRAARTCSNDGRPPGDPNARCASAADPNPIARPPRPPAGARRRARRRRSHRTRSPTAPVVGAAARGEEPVVAINAVASAIRTPGYTAGGSDPVRPSIISDQPPATSVLNPRARTDGDQLIPEQEQPVPGDQRRDQQDERPADQQVVADLPEPPRQTREVPDEPGELLVGRGRVGREERDQSQGRPREEEQDQVGRSPGSTASVLDEKKRMPRSGLYRAIQVAGRRAAVVGRLLAWSFGFTGRPPPERSKAAGSRSSGSASGPRSFDERRC